MLLNVSERQAKLLAKIMEEVVEFPDGSMTFRKHFKSKDGSTIGWYAIQECKEE